MDSCACDNGMSKFRFKGHGDTPDLQAHYSRPNGAGQAKE